MMRKISLTSFGDKPIDGSSIRMVFGRLIIALPIATICCSPPESVPASWRRRSLSRGKYVYTLSRSSLTCEVSLRLYAPISRFSCTLMRVNTWRPSGTCAMPRVTIRFALVFNRFWPLNMMLPDLAGTSPVMVCRVVVLPAPFAPISDTISPSSTCRLMSLTASMAP